jgi:preprotein translocase subunit YajC
MDMTIAFGLLLFLLQAPGGGGGGLLGALLPMVIIFGIFYFLVIRPQQKRQRQAQKERDDMLNALKAGDKVITTGGIYGTIVAARDSSVTLRIADKVTIELLRSAVAGLQSSDLKEVEAAKQ